MNRPLSRTYRGGLPINCSWFFVVAVLCASNGEAQQRLFVEGTAAVDYDGGTQTRILGVGLNISPRYDIRVESEFASWDTSQDHSCGSRACLELNYATRAASTAVLLGRHFRPARRVRVDVLGGFGVLGQELHASGYFDDLAPDGTVARHSTYDDHDVEHFAAFTLGLDVGFLAAKHFAVVPRWRAHAPIGVWYASTHHNAGVALRWQF